MRLESEDLERILKVLSCWTAKDTRRMISHLASGSLIQILVSSYIHTTAVQNLSLFVLVFNSLLTHESAAQLCTDVDPVLLSALIEVVQTVPRSRLDMLRVSGSIDVLSFIAQKTTSSTQILAIDEIKIEEAKSGSPSLNSLKTVVFGNYGKEIVTAVLTVYTRDYWSVECESGAILLRNEAGALLNFILSRLEGELSSFKEAIIPCVVEFSGKLERVMQVIMRNQSPRSGFSLSSYRVEKPMDPGLLEMIVTITRLLNTACSLAFTAESWTTVFQLVFIHSAVRRLIPKLFSLPEDALRHVLLGRGIMHKYVKTVSDLDGPMDFQGIIKLFVGYLQEYVYGKNGTLGQDIKKHSLWKQFISKQKITSPTDLKRTTSLVSRNLEKVPVHRNWSKVFAHRNRINS